jgi:dTDP-4-amino-4,6-dideoxygalactose transaminase
MNAKIPFNKPYLTGRELSYIAQAVESRGIAADGTFTQLCSKTLAEKFGVNKVLMTPSCTAALEMAVALCNLEPGDEVILPSFTFVSTANAILKANGRPVFVDIRPDTLNLDESLIESAITEKTRAIIPVHYAGVACDMHSIMQIARENNLRVIEDAAQAVNATYNGQALGAIGDLGAFSFHHTKNYFCGEGGALCINDPSFAGRAEILREKGTNRTQFIRGEVDKYTWVDTGSSYLPNEIGSAFLYAQLQEMDWITERRREIWETYFRHLQPLQDSGIISLPVIPENCQSNYHVFYVLLREPTLRENLRVHLRRNGVETAFHYVPLHSSPMGRTFGYEPSDLPVTENLSSRILRLPVFPELAQDDVLRVVHHLNTYLQNVDEDVLLRA